MENYMQKLVTTKFIADILAMLLRENHYNDFREKDYEIVTAKGPAMKCIKIGDTTFDEEKDNEEKNPKKIHKYLWGLFVPEEITENSLISQVQYIFSTNCQIVQQADWDLNDKELVFLGNYKGLGGIKKGNIKIVLNFMDLYDIYKDDKKIHSDIYADQLEEILKELED